MCSCTTQNLYFWVRKNKTCSVDTFSISRTINVWPTNLLLCNYLKAGENLNNPEKTVQQPPTQCCRQRRALRDKTTSNILTCCRAMPVCDGFSQWHRKKITPSWKRGMFTANCTIYKPRVLMLINKVSCSIAVLLPPRKPALVISLRKWSRDV